MLRASGAFDERAALVDRVMDSGDLECEKGIMILAKHTAIAWQGMMVNVDTPGHADFGGEVERGLSMVDGVVLLVDTSKGPLPQTRFVLRKTLLAGLPVVLVVNKTDRPDARCAEVVDESLALLLELADERELGEDLTARLLDLPVVYASGRAGRNRPADGELPDEPGLDSLFDLIRRDGPAARRRPRRAATGARHQLRRHSVPRPHRAAPHSGRRNPPGPARRLVHRGRQVHSRQDHRAAAGRGAHPGAGRRGLRRDLVAVAGIPQVTIGDTLADPENPIPVPRVHVDEPAISVTIGINTSPLVGRDPHPGNRLTARQVKSRLETELVGNVSLRVLPTERPDTWWCRAVASWPGPSWSRRCAARASR